MMIVGVLLSLLFQWCFKTPSLFFCFAAPFHGFAFWFDVEFNGPEIFASPGDALLGTSSNGHVPDTTQRKKRPNPNEALVLSTAPEDPPTHWQQVCEFFTIGLL